MMTVKNEEDWIEKSISSIIDLVNEVVVVDNGSDDRTASILASLKQRFNTKLQVFTFPQEDFCAAAMTRSFKTLVSWV